MYAGVNNNQETSFKEQRKRIIEGIGGIVFENKYRLVRHPDPGKNPEGSSPILFMKAWPEVLTDGTAASSR